MKYDNNTLVFNKKYTIYLNPKWCTCITFLDLYVCPHYFAACLLLNLIPDDEDREFLTIRTRGRLKGAKGALKH